MPAMGGKRLLSPKVLAAEITTARAATTSVPLMPRSGPRFHSRLTGLIATANPARRGATLVDDHVARAVGEDRWRIVRHSRSITFQMAEVMAPRDSFQQILAAIAALRPLPSARC